MRPIKLFIAVASLSVCERLYKLNKVAFLLKRYLEIVVVNSFENQGKSDLNQEVDLLKNEKTELEHQITELKQRAEQADRRAAETRLAEERKHTEEIAFLKKTNQQLKVHMPYFTLNFVIPICQNQHVFLSF